MGLVNTLLRMVASTRVPGKMEDNMVKGFLMMQMDTVEQEFGSMGREPLGSMNE